MHSALRHYAISLGTLCVVVGEGKHGLPFYFVGLKLCDFVEERIASAVVVVAVAAVGVLSCAVVVVMLLVVVVSSVVSKISTSSMRVSIIATHRG